MMGTKLTSILNPQQRSRTHAYMGAVWNAPLGVSVLPLAGVVMDTMQEWDNALYRFTPVKSGYYLITATLNFQDTLAAGTVDLILDFNGGVVLAQASYDTTGTGTWIFINCSTVVDLTDQDYVDLWINNAVVAGLPVRGNFQDYSTKMILYRLGGGSGY